MMMDVHGIYSTHDFVSNIIGAWNILKPCTSYKWDEAWFELTVTQELEEVMLITKWGLFDIIRWHMKAMNNLLGQFVCIPVLHFLQIPGRNEDLKWPSATPSEGHEWTISQIVPKIETLKELLNHCQIAPVGGMLVVFSSIKLDEEIPMVFIVSGPSPSQQVPWTQQKCVFRSFRNTCSPQNPGSQRFHTFATRMCCENCREGNHGNGAFQHQGSRTFSIVLG